MTHDEAFLDDVRAHLDDAPRRIYADWLEENGRPERRVHPRSVRTGPRPPSARFDEVRVDVEGAERRTEGRR